MSFEEATIETDEGVEAEDIMVNQSDIRYADDVIEKIKTKGLVETMTLTDYNIKQMEEMRSDPNRHLTALSLWKEDKDVSDQELGMHFLKEDEYGFSLSFLFRLRNKQYREKIGKEDMIKSYNNMKKEIESGLKKHEEES